ncbi:CBS domain-containing protein [Yinghuangia seranimata]|uniref:CBS domain-containing protein n=1 Tax=Yinghuangia seranimata TaxID=408067 RepID=UPI00248CDE1F|nr:CBS domain-containing protein [Yinghuangia seranimata]MDI2125447.1 CBS domain-containing protein [Yinghuangia seranimata]
MTAKTAPVDPHHPGTRRDPVAAPPRVAGLMREPVAVDVADTLWTAMEVMLSRGLRHLVVTRQGASAGLLSDRDLAATWAMDPLGLKNRCAGDALGPARPFVAPDVDVVRAAAHLRTAGADALVVTDAALVPLGVVTDHDLLGALAELLREDA